MWRDDRWLLRGIGASGTWLDGVRITPGQDCPVSVGQRLAFGGDEATLEVLSVAPPSIFARHGGTGEEVEAGEDDRLHLPCGDIYFDPEVGWVRQTPAGVVPTPLQIEGWRIHWPGDRADPTLPVCRTLASARAVLTADRNLNVRLQLRWPDGELDLKQREEHHPLYMLALERLRGDHLVPVEFLLSRCGYPRARLDVYLGRARNNLFMARIPDADALYEAPRGFRRFGLPPERIEIHHAP